MDFILYLLVNAVLLLRPPEIWPELREVPLYLYVMLPCMLASLPAILGLFLPGSGLKNPIYLLVLAILANVAVTHLVHNDFERAWEETIAFAKVVVYLTLFIAVVNTPARLKTFFSAVILFSALTTIIGLLQFNGIVEFNNDVLKVATENPVNSETGLQEKVDRLQMTGILQDPNEFCVFLGVMVILALSKLTDDQSGMIRFLWVLPMGLFLTAIYLTMSRGGLLALVGGLLVYGNYAYGGKRGLAIALVALPLLILGFAARGESASTEGGTGQERIQMWAEWLQKYRDKYALGHGPEVVPPVDAKLKAEEGMLAHNSFLQAFGDMGTFGGICFFGTFFFALACLHRYGFSQVYILDPDLRRLYPFIMGAIAVYGIGLMTLTLPYVVPTYLVLGLPIVYSQMTRTYPPLPEFGFQGPLVLRWIVGAVGFLAFMYLFVKIFYRPS